MATKAVTTQADLGRRVERARDEASLTQSQLAAAIGLDRTAVSKIESGARKVSATELVRIASALDRPIDWFVVESSPAVLSRRRDPSTGGHAPAVDAELDRVARDVALLRHMGILRTQRRPSFKPPRDVTAAEKLARQARDLLPEPHGPIHDLQRACERVGLLAFSVDLGVDGGDAAHVEVDDTGVALINGASEPGRRRFSLAHELGHHLVGDAYHSDASTDTERMLNAFAVHFLMPHSAVAAVWHRLASRNRRLAAVAVAVQFRVSWTAACNQLRNLSLIDNDERDSLVAQELRRGELVELGERWIAELDPPAIPPDFGRQVIAAFRSGRLTAARTVELLGGTVSEDDLPPAETVPVEQLRRDFDPLE